MKITSVLLLVAVSALFAVAGAHEPKQSLTVDISTEKPTLKVGSEVRVEVTLTNTSSRPVLIQERNPATDYKIDVRDERGKAVPETDFGRKLKEPPVIPTWLARQRTLSSGNRSKAHGSSPHAGLCLGAELEVDSAHRYRNWRVHSHAHILCYGLRQGPACHHG